MTPFSGPDIGVVLLVRAFAKRVLTRRLGAAHDTLNPVLPLFFWKKARKTTPKKRIFCPYGTPKIPGKEGENTPQNKEILARRKTRNSNKTRKGRTGKFLFLDGRKSCDNYCRIASKSYRRSLNHWRSLVVISPHKTHVQTLVLRDPALVALRFEFHDWRACV